MKFTGSDLLGQVCWVGLARSGFLIEASLLGFAGVFWVGIAASELLGYGCWVRFSVLGLLGKISWVCKGGAIKFR